MLVAAHGVPPWRALIVLVATVAATSAATGSGSGLGRVAKVGPAHNWLVRVPLEERAEIARKCSPTPAALRLSGAPTATTNATSNASSLSEERILDDERAPRGSFKYAAALAHRRSQIGGRWGAACGATFVSRRHLLTAAHCISGPEFFANALTLLVGGVCLNGGERDDDCPGKADMVEVGVEFIFAPYFHHTRRDPFRLQEGIPDIAIIQLAMPMADDGRMEAACLPGPNDPLPLFLTAFGWGRRGDLPADFFPTHLRYVEGSTLPLPRWTHGLSQLPECKPALTRNFCLFPVRGQRMNGTAYYGDSGAGVVWPSLTVQATGAPTTLYGISSGVKSAVYSLNEAAGEPREERVYAVETDVASYLAELCYYTELCGRAGPVRGVGTTLRFGSVYMSRLRSVMPPSMGPFVLVSYDEDARNQRHCVGLAASYRGNLPPLKPIPDFTWAAALVDTGGEAPQLVCTATLISSRHLLVSRFCLLAYMTSRSGYQSDTGSGNGNKRSLPRLQVTFDSGPMKIHYPVEFIAWLSKSALQKGSIHAPENSELAIVQLQAGDRGDSPVDVNVRHPACIESEQNVAGYGNTSDGEPEAAVAYWWATSGAEKAAELRRVVVRLVGKFPIAHIDSGANPKLTMPSDLLLVTRPPNTSSVDHYYGIGLMDSRNYYLLGLLAYERGPNEHLYWHVWEYSGTMCLYLNVGCRPNAQGGASYLDNRIPYLNRFLYFD